MALHQPPQKRLLLQSLTCIRQRGIKRLWDGTTTYSFVAFVHKELPAISITLTLTPQLLMTIQAQFDETLRQATNEEEPV